MRAADEKLIINKLGPNSGVDGSSLVPRPSRLHAIILRAIIWVAFARKIIACKREGLGTRLDGSCHE